MVEIFKGNLPVTTATPPFCYRVLMPLIVSLFPTDPILTFCAINVLLAVVLAWITYFLAKTFFVSEFGAFVATGLSSVSIMTISLGSVALTDMAAMICMGLVLVGIRQHWNPAAIMLFLIIGVAFKETVILAAVAWVIITVAKARRPQRTWDWRRTWFWNWRKRWTRSAWAIVGLLVAVGFYFCIRWLWVTVGVPINDASIWKWNHLWNFINRPDGVIDSFWLGFMLWIPAFVVVIILQLTGKKFNAGLGWLWQTGIPFLVFLFVGLFTAYFSLRFIWPLYFSMVPIVAQAATIIGNKIVKPLEEAARGLLTVSALLISLFAGICSVAVVVSCRCQT